MGRAGTRGQVKPANGDEDKASRRIQERTEQLHVLQDCDHQTWNVTDTDTDAAERCVTDGDFQDLITNGNSPSIACLARHASRSECKAR